MYRRYENPNTIECLLAEAKELMAKAIADDDEAEQMEMAEVIHELKDRLRFAWADDEAECYGYDY